MFPFDTTGGEGEWYLKKSKEDEDEYHWDVFVRDEPNKTEYDIAVYVEKGADVTPEKGNFDSLLNEARNGVQISKVKGDWGDGLVEGFVQIESVAQPDGLRVVLKGDNVKRIFASKPETVRFEALTPKHGKLGFIERVEYK